MFELSRDGGLLNKPIAIPRMCNELGLDSLNCHRTPKFLVAGYEDITQAADFVMAHDLKSWRGIRARPALICIVGISQVSEEEFERRCFDSLPKLGMDHIARQCHDVGDNFVAKCLS